MRTDSPTRWTALAAAASASSSSTSCATAASAATACAPCAVNPLLRVGALASLGRPGLVAAALIAAQRRRARGAAGVHVSGTAGAQRWTFASAAAPPREAVAAAALLGVLSFFSASASLRRHRGADLAGGGRRIHGVAELAQIGGQTGDVLGAVEQVSEIVILARRAALSRARSCSGSSGSLTGCLSFAERSSALVSISRLCASAAVAACVGRPSETRLSQESVSSRIGPRNSPSAMSPGG